MDDLIQTPPGADIYTTHMVVELTAFRQQHGTVPTPMPIEMTDEEVIAGVREMLATGQVIGIDADPDADLTGFAVTRYEAKDGQPNRVLIRPEAKFGA